MSHRTGRLSRRGFVVGGLGIAALGACSAPPTRADGGIPPSPSLQSLAAPTTTAQDPVSIEQVHSTARNTGVELITMRPAGATGKLQVCLALHGKGANARMFLDLGVPEMLNNLMAQGVPPFAVVAVDGGDNYWVARGADDPQQMLAADVPTWLTNRGFADLPFAALGISMGGYGALNYARKPGLSAVAVISAALFDSWTDAKTRNAFVDQAQWEATEPLRHVDDFRAVQLGVWCGTSDPFVAQARELSTKAHPRITAIGAGAHDAAYWRKVLPEALRFVGETLP